MLKDPFPLCTSTAGLCVLLRKFIPAIEWAKFGEFFLNIEDSEAYRGKG